MARLVQAEGKRLPPRTRGRPTPDVAAQIDGEILRAAQDMFLTYGYERTSMAMVTEAASVSKTTLYARYDTKADLFRATVRYTLERIANQTLSPTDRRHHELSDGLRTFGYDAMRISLAPTWSSYERLIYTEGARFPELIGIVAERIDVGKQTISRFIRHCAERDQTQVSNPERIASIYVMGMRGFYTSAVLRGAIPTENDIAAFVDDLVAVLMAARHAW
jgi:AcrR family transcriptional regulator